MTIRRLVYRALASLLYGSEFLVRPWKRLLWMWRRESTLGMLRRAFRRMRAVSYRAWLAKTEPTGAQLAQQIDMARALHYRPLISVILQVGDASRRFFDDTVQSLVRQTYACWELCLVVARDAEAVRPLSEEWTRGDHRFRVQLVDRHSEACNASNVALAMARGDFIMVLTPGDTLAADALFEVAVVLNERSDADLIYFDEDRISGDDGARRTPFFKPGWSPELLLSVNYLAHGVVRRSLVREAGGFTQGVNGAREWDLALRCTQRTARIIHIARVLYHGRDLTVGSSNGAAMLEGQRRCVEAHLRRLGIANPKAGRSSSGVMRATWPTSGSKVSIVIPSKDRVDVLKRCVTSIVERTTYRNFEVLILDNGSAENATSVYYASLASCPRVRVVNYPRRFNYSAVNNAGARLATGTILLFLNNDIEVLEPDWLEEMVRWTERPEIGAVGPKLLYPDGSVQHAGVVVGLAGIADHVYRYANETEHGLFGSVNWYRNCTAVTGACMMMRREIFEEIGGFDEAYQLVYSDVEICLRIVERGYRIVYTPFARARHHEGATRGRHNPRGDVGRACGHMGALVETGDPYFNPNLSYSSPIPMLPPRGDRSRFERLRRIARRAHI